MDYGICPFCGEELGGNITTKYNEDRTEKLRILEYVFCVDCHYKEIKKIDLRED